MCDSVVWILVKHGNIQNISTDSRFRFKKYPTYNDFVNFYSNEA